MKNSNNPLIIQGDCLEILPKLKFVVEKVDLIFADPPYNQGVDYGEGQDADKLPTHEYLQWCKTWMKLCYNSLKPDGTFCVMISDEYADYFGIILRRIGFHRRSWVKWYETFGVYCHKKFSRTSRHVFYCVKDPKNFTFNADAIRVPSARQEKYGDSRANPKGKVPDDVWTFPRTAGTFKRRVLGIPNQIPLEITNRIVAGMSNPDELVVDPFGGSFGTGVSAICLGRRFTGIEKNEEYVEIARERLVSLDKSTPSVV